MSSLRWLNLFRRSAKTKTNRAARKARAKANISFEPLEPRVMLSNTTLLWTNGSLVAPYDNWNNPGNWTPTGGSDPVPESGDALVFDEANVIYGALNAQNPSINDIPGLSLTSITINGNPGDQFPISGDAITLTGPGGISNNMPNLLNIAGTAITTPGYTTLSFAGITVAPDQQSPAATADTWSNTAGTLNVTSPISLADATGTPGSQTLVHNTLTVNVTSVGPLANQGAVNFSDGFDTTYAPTGGPSTPAYVTVPTLQDANGNDALSVTGGGTLTVSNPGQLAGTTTLSAATGSTLDVGGGNLDLYGNTLNVTGGGVVAISDSIVDTSGSPTSDALNVDMSSSLPTPGALLLSGNNATVTNAFPGATTVNSGVLSLGSNDALGLGSLTVNGGPLGTGGTLALTSITAASPITLPTSVTINGTGVGGAGAIDNYSGANTLSGTVTIGASGATIDSSASGDTLTIGDINNSGGDVTLNGTAPISIGTVSSLDQSEFTPAMTSPNAVTVTGNLTLAADTTLVNNSTLVLASGVPATPSTINLNGFTLTIQGTGATTIGDNIIDNSGGASNDGLIIDNTAGTVTLSGANTYAGTTTIDPGVLLTVGATTPTGDSALSLGAGAVYVDTGATLALETNLSQNLTIQGAGVGGVGAIDNVSGTNTLSGTVTIGSGGATIGASGGSLAVDNVDNSSGKVTLVGTANITLNNLSYIDQSLFAPQMTGQAEVAVTGSIQLPFDSTTTLANGSTLFLGISSGSNLDLNGGVLVVTGSGATTIGDNIVDSKSSASDGIVIDTTGLTLSGTNTYAGTTTLEDGLFTVSNTHTLGGGEVYVDTSAALGLSNGITLAQNMTILGNGVAGHGAIDIVTGQDVLTGTITLTGPGASIGSGQTVGAGSLVIDGNITNSSTAPLTFVGANPVTVNGTLSSIANNALSATMTGSAVVTVAGAQTLQADTAVGGGTGLAFNNGSINLDSFVLTIDGATNIGDALIDSTGSNSDGVIVNGDVTLSGNNTVTGSNNGQNSYVGATTITNSGTLNLAASNSLGLGSVVIEGGEVLLGQGLSLPQDIGIAGSGVGGLGAIQSGGNNTLSGSITVETGGATIGSSSGTLTISGTLDNSSNAATLSGAGSFSMSTVSSLDESLLILDVTSPGTVTVTGSMTLPEDGSTTLLNNGTLILGAPATSSTLDLNGGTLTVEGTGAITIGDSLLDSSPSTGGLVIDMTAPGTLALTGNDSGYSGPITVQTGTLAVGSNNALGTGSLTVDTGATIGLTNSVTLTQSFNIAGSGAGGVGALEALGGTDTLSGAISLSGSATIGAAGGSTLILGGLNNTVSLGSDTLTVVGAGNVNIGDSITGSGGSLTKGLASGDTGTLALWGVDTFGGATTINDGTLAVANSDALQDSTVSIGASGAIAYVHGDLGSPATVLLGGLGGTTIVATDDTASDPVNVEVTAVTGTGSQTLTVSGTGTLTLTGDNDATEAGFIAVDSGATLVADATDAIGAGAGVTVPSGATLAFAGSFTDSGSETITIAGNGVNGAGAIEGLAGSGSTWAGPITLSAPASIGTDSTGTLTLGGTIAMNASELTYVGGGQTVVQGTITGNSTQIGGTAVNIQNPASGNAGSSSYNPATGDWTMTSTGGDIWAGTEQCEFEYATASASAPATWIAHVQSYTAPSGWTKVGIMVQASLGAETPCVFVSDTGGNGVQLQWGTAGNNVGNLQGAGGTGPQWIELTYDGAGNFSAYYNTAADASTPPTSGWNQAGGTQYVPMGGSTFLVGLEDCSHSGNSATVVFDYANMLVVPGPGVTVAAATGGIVNFSGATVDYYNKTAVNSGTLQLNNVTLDQPMNLDVTPPGTVDPLSGSLNLNGQTLTVSGSGNVTLGAISDTSLGASSDGIVMNGTGVLSLTGANTFPGGITINSGTVVADATNALGSGSGVTVASGGTLAFSGGFSAGSEPVSITGTGAGSGAIVNLGGTNSYAGTITLTGNATIGSTAGQLTLSSINLVGGNVTFAGGGQTVVTGSITGPSSMPGMYEFQVDNDTEWGQALPASDADSYGVYTVQEPVMGETSNVNNNNSYFPQGTWANNDTWVYEGLVYFPNSNGNGTGTLSFAKQIDDDTWLTINGVNYINNGSFNTAMSTGAITLPTGWYPIELNMANGGGGAGASGASAGWNGNYGIGFRVDSGSGDGTAGSTNGGDYVIPSNGIALSSTTEMDGSTFGSLFPSGLFAIGSTLGVNVATTGAGAVTFNGATTSYPGATTVAAGGTLNLTGASGTPFTNTMPLAVQVAATGALNTSGYLTLGANVTVNDAAGSTVDISGNVNLNGNTLAFTGAGNPTVGDQLSGSAGSTLTMSGSGTLTVVDSNSGYTGAVTVNSGTVAADAINALGAGAVTVNSGGTLVVEVNSALDSAGAGVTVNAGGTLAFSGGLTNPGSETINIAGSGVGGVGAIDNASGNNSYAGTINLTGVASIGSTLGNTLILSGPLALGGNVLTTVGAGTVDLAGTITGTYLPGLEGYYFNGLDGAANQNNWVLPSDGWAGYLTPGDAEFFGNATPANATLAATEVLDNTSPIGDNGSVGEINFPSIEGGNYGNASFTAGLAPGVVGPSVLTNGQGNDIGALWTGFITIPALGSASAPADWSTLSAGQATPINFFLQSDDGSALWIGGAPSGATNVISRGLGGTGSGVTMGTISLVPGKTYPVTIGYTGQPGGNCCFLSWDLSGLVTNLGNGGDYNGAPTGTPLVPASAFTYGNAEINQAGSGTLEITGTLDITPKGLVNANAGTVDMAGTLGAATTVNANGGTVNLGDAGTPVDLAGKTLTVSGNLSEVNVVNVALDGGTLAYDFATPATPTLNPANITGTGTIANNGTAALTITGPLTLNGNTVTLGGSGIIILENTVSGSGTLDIDGTVQLANDDVLQNANVTSGPSGVLTFSAGVDAPVIGTLTGTGTIDLQDLSSPTPQPVDLSLGNSTADFAFDGSFTGIGSLTKVGSDTVTLGGISTYQGATDVNQGTLEMGAPTTPASLPTNFNGYGTAVNGYQDFFTSATMNPAWTVVVPSGGNTSGYSQTGGELVVGPNRGSYPSHLAYEPAGLSASSDWNELAMVQITGTANDIGGIAADIAPGDNSNAINLVFDSGPNNNGQHNNGVQLLNDNVNWGPADPTTFSTNTWYWMRLVTNGDNITAEFWPANGTTSESDAWTTTWTQTNLQNGAALSGFAGICAANGYTMDVGYVLIQNSQLPLIPAGMEPPLLPATTTVNIAAGASWNLNGSLQTVAGLSGYGGGVGNIALNSGAVNVDNASPVNFDLGTTGTISGTGTVGNIGAGTLTVSGIFTLTGTVTLSAASGSVLDVADGTLNLNGQTLAGGGAGNVNIEENAFTDGLAGDTVAMNGSGILTLTGAQVLGGPAILEGNSGLLTLTSGALDLNGNTLTVTGTGQTTIAENILNFQDTSSGGDALTMNGSGTLAVTSVVQLTGNATIAVNAGVVALEGASTQLAGFNLTVAGSGAMMLDNLQSDSGAGDGSLTQTDTGTVTVNGTGNYGFASGGTYVDAGILLPTNSAALENGTGLITVNGGALGVAGGVTVTNPLNITGSGSTGAGAIEEVTTSESITYGLNEGVVNPNNDWSDYPTSTTIQQQPQAGEWLFSGPPGQGYDNQAFWGNNQTWVYTGEMYISPTTSSVAFTAQIDDGWTVDFNGTWYDNNGNGTTTRPGNGTNMNWGWTTPSINTASLEGTWVPVEIRFQNGGGGAGATGPNNGFEFETNNQGNWTIPLNAPGNEIWGVVNETGAVTGPITLGAGGATIGADNGTTLNISGTLTTNGNNLGFTGAGSTNFSDQISGSSTAVAKTGSGTVTLSDTAANTYGGGTTISAGYVYITNSGSLGSALVSVQSNGLSSGALQVPGGLTVANALQLAGSGPTGAGAVEHVGQSAALTPGLDQSLTYGNFNWAANPDNAGVTLLPLAGQEHMNIPGAYGGLTYDGSVWGNNDTDIYDGYMFVPATSGGSPVTSVQLIANCDDSMWMAFDNQGFNNGNQGGTRVLNVTGLNPGTDNPAMGNLDNGVAGSWYPVEFRFGNGGGGAGGNFGVAVPAPWNAIYSSNFGGWGNYTFGVGYEFNGTGSDGNISDYNFAADAGTGNLFETQSYNATLSGNITLVGNATIGSDNGTLALSGGTINTGDTVYQLAFTGSGATNVVDPIATLVDPSSTTPALVKSGSGALTFSGPLTLAGNTTLSATAGSVTINTTTDLEGHNFTVAGSIGVTAAGPIVDNSVGGGTGPGTVTVNLTGVNALYVLSPNTYAGGTTVESGVLDLYPNWQDSDQTGIDYLATLGSGPVTVDAAASFEIWAPAAATIPNAINLNGPGASPGAPNYRPALDQDGGGGLVTMTGNFTLANSASGAVSAIGGGGGSSNSMVIKGNISGTGGLMVEEGTANVYPGTNNALTFSGQDSYTGATTVVSGNLVLATSDALSTAGTGTSGVLVESGADLKFSGGVNVTAPGLIVGGFGVGGSAGGAVQSIGGVNTFNGSVTLSGYASIGASSGTLTITGGTLNEGSYGLATVGAGNVVINEPVSGGGATGPIYNTDYVGFTGGNNDPGGGNPGTSTQILNWSYSSDTTSINDAGFATGNMQLNGSYLNGTAIQLTDGGHWEGWSAFTPTRVDADAFSSAFQFQFTNPSNGGFTFCLQNFAANATAGNSDNMGYGGNNINGSSSMAVEFDISNGNSIMGVDINGAIAWSVNLVTSSTNNGVNFHVLNGGVSDVFGALVTYDGLGTVTVTVTDESPTSPNYLDSYSGTFADVLPVGTPSFTGGGGLYKTGAGTLVINGTNTTTAAAQVVQGTLDEATTASMNGAGISMAPNTVLQLGTAAAAGVTATEPIALPSSGTFEIDSLGGNNTIQSQLTMTNSAGLTMGGGGTLTVSNANNTYSGPFTLIGGTLAFNDFGALAISQPFNVDAVAGIGSDNGTLTLSGNITDNGLPLSFSGDGNTTVNGVISGVEGSAGLLEGQLWDGNNGNTRNYESDLTDVPALSNVVDTPRGGEWQWSTAGPNNIWSSNNNDNTWVYRGYMYIPAGVTGVAFSAGIDDGWTISIGSANGTFSSLTQIGSAGWSWVSEGNDNGGDQNGFHWNGITTPYAVTPNSWYPVDIRFTNGNGDAGPTGAGNAANTNTNGNFVYEFTGTGPNATDTWTIAADPGNGTVFATTPPNQAVIMAGTGILTLANAANSYQGATIVNSGTVQFSSDGDLGGPNSSGVLGPVNINAGTLEYSGTGTDASSRVYSVGDPNSTIQVDSSGATLSITGSIGGAGTLIKDGPGALSLPVSDSYPGGTVVELGALNTTGNASLGTGQVTLAGGSLNLQGATAGSNSFTNSLIVVISSNIDVENYSGSMAAAIVAGSTLSVTSGDDKGLSLGTVFLAGNPDFAPAGGVTLSLPNLFDAGVARDISVTGGGTVDITGPAFSLSSGTVVDVALGSTLALNNALALGSLPLLMEGAGAVKDNVSVTLNSGDAIQPGTAGAPGTLDMTGNVVLPSGSGNLTLPSGATVPVGFDVQLSSGGPSLLDVTGTVNLNHAYLNLSALNGFVPSHAGETFTIISAPGTGTISGTFANAGSLSTPNADYSVSTQGDDQEVLTVTNLTATPTSMTGVTSSASSVTYGTPLTFTAVVSDSTGSGAPAGSVDFSDGGTDLSSLPNAVISSTSSSSAPWETTYTLFLPDAFNVTAPGGDTITAQFTPTNDQVFDGISGTMTQIVTQRYITLTAAAWDKIYDGSTSATGAAPTVTGGSLAVNPVTGDNDTLDYTESFTSRNAISSGFLSNPLIINSATGSVSDGNGGANYSVTYLNSTAGAILPLAITVTANAVTKVYDGGTSVATATSGNQTPSITGSLAANPGPGGLDTADFTESYASPAAGTGLTIIPSGSVNDGNGGLNYSVNFVDNYSGVITQTATHFVVTTQISPLSVTAGSGFLLELEAKDAAGNLVPGYSGTVSFTSSDPNEATLPSEYTMTFQPGTGIAFALVSLEHVDLPSNLWTITASDGTISGTSNGVTVTNGAPTQVAISTQPDSFGPSVQAGFAIPMAATLEDQFGNPVLGDAPGTGGNPYQVTLTATAASPSTLLFVGTSMTSSIPTASVDPTTGIATFSEVNIHHSSNSYYQLTATVAITNSSGVVIGNLGQTSDSFTVTPGVATHLTFTGQPLPVVAGTSDFSAAVSVEDSYGNAVTGDMSSVALTLNAPASGDVNGALNGASTPVGVSGGVAAFSGLSISQPNTGYSAAGTGYTLTATDAADGGITATSSAFNTTLVVTNVSMTSTGFTAAFSEPVDPADVNLYGTQSLPSVCLTGEYTEGQVHGTLVLDSTTAYLASTADSITDSDGTVTVTTTATAPLGFTVGDVVTISGVSSEPAADVPSGSSDPAAPYNGSFIVTGVSGSQFTYTDVAGLPAISPTLQGVSAGLAVDTGNTMTYATTTLVNKTGLPIAGVSSADSTSAILVPDTYLVYFASGSSAFTTLSNQALDGPDSTGFSPAPSASSGASYRQPVYGPYSELITIGPADFTANEMVDNGAFTTATDVAVVIPAFARGPGNTVNLPNASGPIASIADNSSTGTVTVTTLVQDQALAGQQVAISGLTGAAAVYNGTWTILTNTNYGGSPPAGKLPFSSVFTFSLAGSHASATGGSFSILTGIPISLTDTGGVTQATFTLTYNPALLSITSSTNTLDPGLQFGTAKGLDGDTLAQDFGTYPDATFTVTVTTPGTATIVFNSGDLFYDGVDTGTAGLPASAGSIPSFGPIVLGHLDATVPATAVDAYASKDLLTISVTSISGEDLTGATLVPGVNALGSQAVHVVAFLGDATGDGTLDSSDVGLMGNVLGDVSTGFNAYKLADPAIIGDIAGAGYVSLSDGNDLINYVNGGYGSNAHTVPYLPPYPTGLGTILSTGPDPAVSLPSALQVGTDGTLAVPVDIDDPLPAANDGMMEATVALTYDPAVLSVSPSDVHLGSVPASGSGWTLQSNIDQATGQIAVTILSTTPIASSTAGSLVVIDFHQTGLTAAGTTTVNLVDSVDPNGSAPIYTQVDGQQGPFVLSPAPANAYNPQIDALVTLAGAEGATGSASALSQLTASVVAGPVAPVSAAAAVQAPVSPSAGAAQVPQNLADGLFAALARGTVDPAELAGPSGGEDQAVSQALAVQAGAGGSAQANLDDLLWGDDGEADWLDVSMNS